MKMKSTETKERKSKKFSLVTLEMTMYLYIMNKILQKNVTEEF